MAYVQGKDLKGLSGFFKRITGQGLSVAEVQQRQLLKQDELSSFLLLEDQINKQLAATPSGEEPANYRADLFGPYAEYAEKRKKRANQGLLTFEDYYAFATNDQLNKFVPDLADGLLTQAGDDRPKKINFNTLQGSQAKDGSITFNVEVDTFEGKGDGSVARRTNFLTTDGSDEKTNPDAAVTGFALKDLNALYDAKKNTLFEGAGRGYERQRWLNDTAQNDGILANSATAPREAKLQALQRIGDTFEAEQKRVDASSTVEDAAPLMTPTKVESDKYDYTEAELLNLSLDLRTTTGGGTRKKDGKPVALPMNRIAAEEWRNQAKERQNLIAKKEAELADLDPSSKEYKLKKRNLVNIKAQHNNHIKEGTGADLRLPYREKAADITDAELKTQYNTLLAPKNFNQLLKDKDVMKDFKSLNANDFLTKYSKDGVLDKQRLYGNDFSEQTKKTLKEVVPDEKRTAFIAAVEAGEVDEAIKILGTITLSTEQDNNLAEEVARLNGDFRQASTSRDGRDAMNSALIASLTSLPADSPILPTLLQNTDLALFAETGLLTTKGIDAAKKQFEMASNLSSLEGLSDDFSTAFSNYNNFLDTIAKDEDLTFEGSITRVNELYSNMKVFAKTNADKSALVTARAAQFKRVTLAQLQPGFWAEVFSLGFARGPNEFSLSEQIDVDVVTKNGLAPSANNPVIGFRGNQGYISAKEFENNYGPDTLLELAGVALATSNSNKTISEEEATQNERQQKR